MSTRILSLAVICLCLGSCIGTKKLVIRTEPEGAEITINGKLQEGKTTPMVLEISQKKDLGIVATKPGYETAARTLYTHPGWWSSLMWTKSDPRAQYIEEDEVTLRLKKIPTAEGYRVSEIPPFRSGAQQPAAGHPSKAPALRPVPKELLQ